MWRFTTGLLLGLTLSASALAVAEYDWATRDYSLHPKDSLQGKQERYDRAYDDGQFDAANGLTPYRHRQDPC